MVRILLFCDVSHSPQSAEALTTAKVILAWLNRGWEVDAITSTRSPDLPLPAGSQWERLASRIHYVTEDPDGFFGLARTGFLAARMGYLARGTPWAWAAYQRARDLLRRKEYDVVMSRSYPEATHLAALQVARQTGLPWIANWNDPMPSRMFLKPRGQGPDTRPRLHELHYLNGIIQKASWHTFPSDRLRRYVASYTSACLLGKSSVVPHVSLAPRVWPGTSDRVSLTLCHTGYLNPSKDRDPRRLFMAARRLVEERGERAIALHFVGQCLQEVASAARDCGIDRCCTFHGLASYEVALDHVCQSHMALVLEEDCSEGIYLPSKVSDYVQTLRPLFAVSPIRGTMADLCAQYGGGIAVDCQSTDSIYGGLVTAHDLFAAGKLRTALNTDRLYAYMSESHIVSLYEEMFHRVGVRLAA